MNQRQRQLGLETATGETVGFEHLYSLIWG